MAPFKHDVVVVGSGPNGLAAAVALTRAGLSTLVVEARGTPGGGCRSAALTSPGFIHDVCSAVHPLAVGSPFFRSLALERYGLQWIHPPTPLAHLLPDGTTVTLEREVEATAAQFGRDELAYRRLFKPFVARFDELAPMVLGPLRFPAHPLPTTSPPPSSPSTTARSPFAPSCCCRSRACSTTRVRPPASTRPGPTVTCRTAPRSMSPTSSRSSRAVRPGLPGDDPRPRDEERGRHGAL